MSRTADYEPAARLVLSPALLKRVAEALHDATGVSCTEADAEAWWAYTWTAYETYKKRYRNHTRAILAWASRARREDLQRAFDARMQRGLEALVQVGEAAKLPPSKPPSELFRQTLVARR